ncbi:sulfate ABC transporter permease subunit CysW [Rickettsiales bacterium]|nr:sulfate ABC transporter permease subunit CysW [Rickettsiales bacterium]
MSFLNKNKLILPTSSYPITKYSLLFLATCFLFLFVLLPVIVIFINAFKGGIDLYMKSILDDEALSAIKLTLLVSAISVPLNTIFGICASWLIAKYDFYGKKLLLSIIDLPFSVSPVISGLIYILLFGSYNYFGAWLIENDLDIIFAVPGIVIATIFVTFPFIAKELIPLMEEQGSSEEEAAISLGAGGFKTFLFITLPNIKWALLYGVLLCNARAMGEFGAVSVVSGHIKGLTNTIPLHVEILYNEYNFVAAFAVASILTIMALFTLLLKSVIEGKIHK